MSRELRLSQHGFSACPRCGRHIRLEDEIASTCCPFCDTSILSEPTTTPAPGTLAQLATEPGRAGKIAAALNLASGTPPPPSAPPRDPELDGDPSALVRNRSVEEIVEEKTPRHAVWELTLACDLKCVHCGSRAGKVRSGELSTDECLDLANQLAALGVREITLIGGEAYMRRDWHRIAQEITCLGMGCTMTTGGRNLNEKRLEQAVEAGISSIGVSIDGLEATHDAQRGVPGSWRAAVEASKRIAASPIRLSTNSQINLLSAAELPGIARLMRDIGSVGWQLALTVAMGRAADRPDLLLQPDDLLEIFPLLVWVRERILDPAGIALIMGNNIGYFGPYEHALRYGRELGIHWSGCSAGSQVLGIEADGTIKGCPSLATRTFGGGSIRQKSLQKIVQDAPEVTSMARRDRSDLWGFCGSCYYADVCKAGCSWTTHSLLGRLGNNPYCIHRAMTLDQEGRLERVVKVEAAPGQPFDTGRFEIVVKGNDDLDDRALDIVGVPIETVIETQPDMPGYFSNDQLDQRLKHREPSP